MTHAAPERLVALRLGQLSGEESRELLNHVARCAECQHAAQATLDVRTDARELAQSLAGEEQPVAPSRPSPMRWLAVAAVAAGVLAAIPFLRREERPIERPPVVTNTTATVTAPPPPGPAQVPSRPEPWNALVAAAVTKGMLEAPAVLLSLRPPPDQFRDNPADVPPMPDMRPLGEVVESDRPTFRWPETSGATYTVLVGEKGRVVAQSSPLTTNTWRSETPLPRGRTYSWQVEARRGEETSMFPAPPAAMARFHVLEARLKAQLDAARRAVPGDDLLLGIIAARAGLRDTALQHLRAAAERGEPEARPLLDSVQNWPDA
jgi:hypothetical protein